MRGRGPYLALLAGFDPRFGFEGTVAAHHLAEGDVNGRIALEQQPALDNGHVVQARTGEGRAWELLHRIQHFRP